MREERKGRRIWRRLLWWGGGVFLFLLSLPFILLLLLETGFGLAIVRDLANDALKSDEQMIEIGEIGGSLFDVLTVEKLQIADSEGVWLEVDALRLDWAPSALFSDSVKADSLSAERVALLRPPLPGAETPPEESGPFEIPSLPLAIDVKRLALPEIVLGESLLGVPATLALEGQASLPRSAPLALDLSVERRDGPGGSVTAALRFEPASQDLTLKAAVREPRDGLLARLAGLPALPAIALDLDGAGSLRDWSGRLDLLLDGQQALAGSFSIAGEEAYRFQADLQLDPDGTLPPEFLPDAARPWLAGGASLTARLGLDGDRLSIAQFALATAAVELAIDGGSADLGAEQLDVPLTLRLLQSAPLTDLVPGLSLDGLGLAARASGAFAQPSLRLRAETGALAFAPAALDGLALDVTALPENGGYRLETKADLRGPALDVPALTPWPYGDLTVTATAKLDAGYERLHVIAARLQGQALDVAATGDLEALGLTGALDVTVAGNTPPLSALAPDIGAGPLRLSIDSGLTFAGPEAAIALQLVGDVTGTESLQQGIGPLIGPRLSLAGGVTLLPDGTVELAGVSLLGQDLAVDLDGRVSEAANDLGFSLALEDLARLSALAGTPLAGRFSTHGGVALRPDGRIEATADLKGSRLSAAGERIGVLNGSLAYRAAEGQGEGQVRLAAPNSAYGPLRLAADLAPQADESIRVSDLQLGLGEEVRLNGNLLVQPAGPAVTGRIDGAIVGGRLLAALGVPLSGSGTLNVEASAPGGRQAADIRFALARGELAGVRHGGIALSAQGRDLLGVPTVAYRLEGSEIASGEIRVATVSAEGEARNLAGDPALTARAEVRRIDAGAAQIEQVAMNAEGSLTDLAVTVVSQGQVQDYPLTLDLAGQFKQAGGRQEILLSRLQGEAAALPYSLKQPARLAIDGGEVSAVSLALSLAEAGVSLEAGADRGGRQVTARIESFDLAKLKPFIDGEFTPSGRLNAALDLSGSRLGEGQASLTVDDLVFIERDRAAAPPIAFEAKADFDRSATAVSALVKGSFGEGVRVEGKVPLTIAMQDFSPNLDQDGPLDLRVRWKGQVAPILDFFPLGDQRLLGDAALDLAATGTLANPAVQGSARIVDGRYENQLTGTVIDQLNVTVEGNASRLVISEGRGTDGRNGTLALSGSVDLAGGIPKVDVKFAMTDFLAVRRDDATAQLDADLSFTGGGGDPLLFAGTITNDRIRVDITPDLPASVPTLDVVRLRDGKPIDPPDEEEEGDGTPPVVVNLDLVIDLPRRVFVQGSGLESEWAGRLNVQGTADQPRITGSIGPRRGTFSLFGSEFELNDQGTITFDGGRDIDPQLALSADYTEGDFTATVSASGQASDPQIELSSNPSLPNDEILSRILFGRSTGRLSAIEAFQLAEAAAVLTGAGGATKTSLEFVRDSLGIDVLRLEAGEEGSDDAAVATIGQYIAPNVFLGIRQGTTPGSTTATVEAELTDNIVLEGRAAAGDDSDTGAIIRWQWDY